MTNAGLVLQRFRDLPFATLDRIVTGRLMVLAPHPDDETLGCGGLIAESCRLGRRPIVVILSDGAASHPGSKTHPPEVLASIRAAEVHDALAILGVPAEDVRLLGLKDTQVPRTGEGFGASVEMIARLAREAGCQTLSTTWQHDPHGDHVATYAIARDAARSCGARLLAYPVWGWLLAEDTPLPERGVQGWRLDISPHLATKKRALAAHRSQYGDLVRDDPTGFKLPPSLLALLDQPYEVFLES